MSELEGEKNVVLIDNVPLSMPINIVVDCVVKYGKVTACSIGEHIFTFGDSVHLCEARQMLAATKM